MVVDNCFHFQNVDTAVVAPSYAAFAAAAVVGGAPAVQGPVAAEKTAMLHLTPLSMCTGVAAAPIPAHDDCCNCSMH